MKCSDVQNMNNMSILEALRRIGHPKKI
jgi:hypothetical protein